MPLFNLTTDEDDKKKKLKGAKRRLLDIVTEEVSIVDRAANKHEFLLVKNADGTMTGIEKQEITMKKWDGSKSRFTLEQLMNAVPKAVLKWAKKRAADAGREISKSDLKRPFKEPNGTININGVRNALRAFGGALTPIGLPVTVKQAAVQELEDLLDRISKEDSMSKTKKKLKKEDLNFGNDPGFEDPTEELLEKAKDLIEEVEEDFDLEETSEEGVSEETEETTKMEISASVQKAVLEVAREGLEQTMAFIDVVKEATVIEDEGTDAPLPTSMGRSIHRIIRSFEGITEKFPYVIDTEKLDEQAKPRIASKIVKMIENLMKALEVTREAEITTEKTDYPISPELGQLLFDTQKLADKVLTRYPSVVGKIDTVNETVHEEEEPVEKAGRKLSAKNLDTLKKVQDLIGELLKGSESEEVESGKVTDEDPIAEEVINGFTDSFLNKFSEIAEGLKAGQEANAAAIEKLAGSRPTPNSRKVEKSTKVEKAHWPLDMNRPMDSKSVPEDRFMG